MMVLQAHKIQLVAAAELLLAVQQGTRGRGGAKGARERKGPAIA